MQKILEYKNEDWMKGISSQENATIGGLFYSMDNVDPFDMSGVVKPSLVADEITLTTVPKYITSWSGGVGGTSLVHSDTKLMQVLNDSPYTQTDLTSKVTISSTVVGAIAWADIATGVKKYIYAHQSGGLFASDLSSTDVNILAGFNGVLDNFPLCIGADGNLYVGGSSRLHIITSSTGTAGNSGIFAIDGNFVVRALINDGQYLIIVSDNNAQASADCVPGNYLCRVYIWDYVSPKATYIYDVKGESYFISAEIIDGVTNIFGYNGQYVCSAGNPPRLIRSFTQSGSAITAKPLNASQTDSSKGSVYWIEGGTDITNRQNVYAYGNPTGNQKIWYTPYHSSGISGYRQTVLRINGSKVWVGNDKPSIKVYNVGSTVGTSSFTTTQMTFDTQMRYEYIKIVLDRPLSTGQSIAVTSSIISKTIQTETKSYNASNPRQVLIFKKVGTSNGLFEDLRITVTSVGATIRRLALYATVLSDNTEEL